MSCVQLGDPPRLFVLQCINNNPVYWSDPSGADSKPSINLSFQGDEAVQLIYNILVTAGTVKEAQNQLSALYGFDSFEEFLNTVGKTNTGSDENNDGSADGNGGPKGKNGKVKKEKNPNRKTETYTPAPNELPAYPEAEKLRNGKGLRPGWRLPNGDIAEWDYEKAELEVYNKRGTVHKGAFDPDTGKKKKEGVKGRKASRSKFEIPFESYSPYRDWRISTEGPINPTPSSAYVTGTIIVVMILLMPIGI